MNTPNTTPKTATATAQTQNTPTPSMANGVPTTTAKVAANRSDIETAGMSNKERKAAYKIAVDAKKAAAATAKTAREKAVETATVKAEIDLTAQIAKFGAQAVELRGLDTFAAVLIRRQLQKLIATKRQAVAVRNVAQKTDRAVIKVASITARTRTTDEQIRFDGRMLKKIDTGEVLTEKQLSEISPAVFLKLSEKPAIVTA